MTVDEIFLEMFFQKLMTVDRILLEMFFVITLASVAF